MIRQGKTRQDKVWLGNTRQYGRRLRILSLSLSFEETKGKGSVSEWTIWIMTMNAGEGKVTSSCKNWEWDVHMLIVFGQMKRKIINWFLTNWRLNPNRSFSGLKNACNQQLHVLFVSHAVVLCVWLCLWLPCLFFCGVSGTKWQCCH